MASTFLFKPLVIMPMTSVIAGIIIHFMFHQKLMPEAVSSVATCSTKQLMLEMVQVRIATGVTRVV
jgi:hypothetical protein